MITRETVRDQLLEYLNGRISLAALVDWAENAMVEGGFAPDHDVDMLVDVVMYLAGADTEYFPLTWDTVADFMRQLGSPVKVVPLES